MKLTIASLVLAASSVFASPPIINAQQLIEISNFTAIAYDGNPTAGMSLVIKDHVYPQPSHCRVQW